MHVRLPRLVFFYRFLCGGKFGQKEREKESRWGHQLSDRVAEHEVRRRGAHLPEPTEPREGRPVDAMDHLIHK